MYNLTIHVLSEYSCVMNAMLNIHFMLINSNECYVSRITINFFFLLMTCLIKHLSIAAIQLPLKTRSYCYFYGTTTKRIYQKSLDWKQWEIPLNPFWDSKQIPQDFKRLFQFQI